MQDHSDPARVDSVSRIVEADAHAVYQAFMSAEALAAWRVPEGMEGVAETFEPWEGGRYKMRLRYLDKAIEGKSGGGEDAFEGRFVTLEPDRRVVEEVVFDSEDPIFQGTMRMETILEPTQNGTRVTFNATHVPPGIKPENHQTGMNDALDKLSAFLKG